MIYVAFDGLTLVLNITWKSWQIITKTIIFLVLIPCATGCHVSPLWVFSWKEHIHDCKVVVVLLLDDVLQESVEHKKVDHHVHGNEQPNVNHLKVWGYRKCCLYAGHYGGNHKHQGQADHDTILDINLLVFAKRIKLVWSFYTEHKTFSTCYLLFLWV